MEEVKSNAKDPFVRLDKCGAIINHIDYDSNGRLTYMPYNGIDCPEGKNNKIISSPDAHSIALAYTEWCYTVINNKLFEISANTKEGFVKDALANIDFILTNRLKSEIVTAGITICNAGFRSLVGPYILEPTRDNIAFNRFSTDLQYLSFNNLFMKDVYDNRGCLTPQMKNDLEYAVDPNDVLVKSSRIASYIAADLANIYDKYILETLNNMDIYRFANESIESLGLTRDIVSVNNDYPYTSSVLNEAANNDVGKIIELVEMLVNHAFYVFYGYYKDIRKKYPQQQIEDNSSATPDKIIYVNPKRIDFKTPDVYESF